MLNSKFARRHYGQFLWSEWPEAVNGDGVPRVWYSIIVVANWCDDDESQPDDGNNLISEGVNFVDVIFLYWHKESE